MNASPGGTPIERLRGELEGPAYNRWIGAVAEEADEARGEIVFTIRRRPEMCLDRDGQIVHGGVLASIADIAGHAAVAVWHGAVTPTMSLSVDYLAPAAGDCLRARGILRRLGKRVGRADIEITVDGRLVALGRGTFSIRSAQE